MVSVSYYQQVFLQHISTVAGKYLPKGAVIMVVPSFDNQLPSSKVASIHCTGRSREARDNDPVKKI